MLLFFFLYPGCQRGFFRSEAAVVSGEAVIVILPREKKKHSGRGSYKPHFHANLFQSRSLIGLCT